MTATSLTSLLPLVGGLLTLVACGRYAYRTRDVYGVVLFWSRRLVFTALESSLQRIGILLLFLGVALRYIQILA